VRSKREVSVRLVVAGAATLILVVVSIVVGNKFGQLWGALIGIGLAPSIILRIILGGRAPESEAGLGETGPVRPRMWRVQRRRSGGHGAGEYLGGALPSSLPGSDPPQTCETGSR
jgi:hypothetical protein